MDDICGDVGKSSWPELLGVHESVAVETIERENTSVRVDVMPPGMMGTTDFNCRRVRVWVDANGIVIQVPGGAKGGVFCSAQVAEAHALREGLSFIRQRGLENVLWYAKVMRNEIIQQMAEGKPDDDLRIDSILWECVFLLRCCKNYFKWMPRSQCGTPDCFLGTSC